MISFGLQNRIDALLNSVSIDGVIKLRGGGTIPSPIDIVQKENVDILFFAEFAERYQDLRGDDLDVESLCGFARTNADVFVETRGLAFATRLQSRSRLSTRRSYPSGAYATIEGVASEIIVRPGSARRVRDLSARECRAKIHNFRPVGSGSKRYPQILTENYGVKASLLPDAEYQSSSLALEFRGGNQETYELLLQSRRKGYRRTSSWLALCGRICMMMGLQNLSSVWISSVEFRKHLTTWEHWVNHLSRPFTMSGKHVCDGIVWRDDALKLSLSKGSKGRLEEWGYLIHYFLDAYSERHHPEYRALLACKLLDSVISRHSLQSSEGHDLTRSQRRSLATQLRSCFHAWVSTTPDSVSQQTVRIIEANISSISISGGMSYKESLKWLVDHYDLPSDVPTAKIARARHSLVHTGVFQSEVRNDNRLRQITYREITWTAVALLWRLLGFKRDFPEVNTYVVF